MIFVPEMVLFLCKDLHHKFRNDFLSKSGFNFCKDFHRKVRNAFHSRSGFDFCKDFHSKVRNEFLSRNSGLKTMPKVGAKTITKKLFRTDFHLKHVGIDFLSENMPFFLQCSR